MRSGSRVAGVVRLRGDWVAVALSIACLGAGPLIAAELLSGSGRTALPVADATSIAAGAQVTVGSEALPFGTRVSGGGSITFTEGGDEWTRELTKDRYWRKQSGSSSKSAATAQGRAEISRKLSDARRAALLPPATLNSLNSAPQVLRDDDAFVNGQARGTYRTVCVRLCDGYYWPISFSTGRNNFREDAAACESSCASPAKLFVYPNPGGQPEDMRDLKGRKYGRLKTAWLYRQVYNPSCTCQPHPWEQASLDRHHRYAELMAAGKLSLYASKSSRKSKKRYGNRPSEFVATAAFVNGSAGSGIGSVDDNGQAVRSLSNGSAGGVVTVIRGTNSRQAQQRAKTSSSNWKYSQQAMRLGRTGSSKVSSSGGGKIYSRSTGKRTTWNNRAFSSNK